MSERGRRPEWLSMACLLTVGVLIAQFSLASPARGAPGDLDRTFGTSGIVRGFGGNAIAFQADGKIVVAGDDDLRFAVARYQPDGTLDRTFGGDGIVFNRFGPGPPGCSGGALAVAVQRDGKIVAFGHSCPGALTVARFNANGTLDRSFGDGGAFVTNGGFAGCDLASYGLAGALGLRGKIVAGAWGECRGRSSFVVVRLNRDGTLDRSFSGDGLARATVQKGVFGTAIGEGPVAGVAVEPDGKIVIAGSAVYRTIPDAEALSDVAVVRFGRGGGLDPTFGGGDGKVATKFPGARCGGPGEAMGLAIQSNGRIVVGGMAGCSSGPGTPSHPRWALIRYRANGTLDPTFGRGGTVVSVFQREEGGDAMYGGLALQSDGKIVGGGVLSTATVGGFALARYRANGRLDRTFGTDGTVVLWEGARGGGVVSSADAVAIQSDGKIIGAGAGRHTGLMARFLAS